LIWHKKETHQLSDKQRLFLFLLENNRKRNRKTRGEIVMNNTSYDQIDETLTDSLKKAKDIFNKNSLYHKIEIPNFDCSYLPGTETDGKDLPEQIKEEFFYHLHKDDNSEIMVNEFPCLYVFELIDKNDCKRVIEALQKIKSKNIGRTLPPFKTKIPDSKYLYVGKVEKEVGGRLVTHLGYYQTKGNHGLQLAFWAKEMNPALLISVSIYRFAKEMRPYISAFEKILAKELNPIIGKHK